jgi:RHS repeat-associated protein
MLRALVWCMCRCLIFASLGLLLAPASECQILNVADDTSTPIPGAGHDYIKSLSETVNPANGSVSIRIQTPTPAGRGITLPFSFAYDSNGAAHLTTNFNGTAYWTDNTAYLAQGGWGYSVPMLSNILVSVIVPRPPQPPSVCSDYQDYVFQDPTGGRHSLDVADVISSQSICNLLNNAPTTKLTGGDDYYQATIGTTTSATIVDSAGTVYAFPLGVQNHEGPKGSSSSLPSFIEDRNGNQIVITDLGLQTNGVAGSFTVSDSLGRTLLSSSGFGVSGNTVAVSGLAKPYVVTWGQASINFVPNYVVTSSGTGCASIGGENLTRNVITNIELPNTQSYQFSYESTYGMVNKITYPSGGYVQYTWGVNGLSEPGYFEEFSTNGNVYCSYQYDVPAVKQRTVSFDGTHIALTQTFTYATTWNSSNPLLWTSKTTTVKTTDNVTGLVSTTSYTYSSLPAPTQINDKRLFASLIPVEQTVAYENSAGSALRTMGKVWYDQYELYSQQTVLSDSSASSKPTSLITYNYGAGAQVTDKKEYDYGAGAPGPLLRETVTNYQNFAATPIYPTVASIFNKPCQNIVKDGGGNRYAETDYFYDNGSTGTVCGTAGTPSVTGVSNLTGHDETNYGASSTSPRGNVTTIVKQCFQGTTACASGNPTTTKTYDETGHTLSVKDPNGNTTSYSYADNFVSTNTGGFTTTAGSPPSGKVNNAYLTKITEPAVNVAHVESFAYGYNDGELTQATDENSQTTIYRYNDSFDRPTEIDLPDGGQTEQAYNDAALTVTKCQLINGTAGATCSPTNPPSGWETNVTTMDGLGHVVQTALVSDPDGTTYTATTYDGFSRPYTVTNPYRTTGDLTYGITTKLYDALGRSCLVVPPDFAGSAPASCPVTAPTGDTFTSYSGNQTTVTDEAGKQRTSQMDGLGRLTNIWEAPNASGYNYLTTYVYDPLDDLTGVTQNGSNSSNARIRSFAYDSLSRLTSAANPESGTITYTHDADGNAVTKTALSPNQSATGIQTVATTYTYDSLSRITGKSYQDGYTSNPPTAGVIYGYDGVAATGCTPPTDADSYPVGRRTAMCDGSGATSWTHDKMGRILQERRTIGSVPGKYDTDAYNLDGSVASITPMGGYQVQYLYGGAGRPLSASNTTAPATKFASSATYAPPGQLTGMTVGQTASFSGFIISNAYSNRLQPILLSAASPAATVFSLCFDLHLGIAVNTAPCSFSASTAGDNGNVYQIVNNRDNTRSENFNYDPLNRIQQAYSTGSAWGETFGPAATSPGVAPATPGIDAWGNLTNRSGVIGKTSHEPLVCLANTKNRLGGCSDVYDAAGNLTNGGSTAYVYDAENRLIATGGFSYIYDGDGQRVEKCTEGTTPGSCASGATGTLYWRGTNSDPLTETDLSGNVQNTYIFFNGQRIARRDSTGTDHYYFSDHLGSHGVVENATGSACEQDMDYYPYGGVQNDYCATPQAQNYHFTGKERDSESGLDHFGARYHASSLGRFMTPDWAAKPTAVPYAMFGNPQSLNLYSYVGNNPLLHFDPDGHCWPAQSCFQAIANTVNNFSNNVFNSSASSSPAMAALKTFGAGVLADTVKMAASPLTMGTATGTCMGGNGCSAGGTALAVGGDVLKGAAIAGGLSAAAGGLMGAATDATVLSGHGMYDAANGMTTIPSGTTFTMPTGLGNTISDAYGGAIESGANLSPFTNEMTGAQSYLSGSQAPNLTLYPPEGLNIQGSPTTVSTPTNLNQILQPDMGNVQWAACCDVNPD